MSHRGLSKRTTSSRCSEGGLFFERGKRRWEGTAGRVESSSTAACRSKQSPQGACFDLVGHRLAPARHITVLSGAQSNHEIPRPSWERSKLFKFPAPDASAPFHSIR